MDKQKYLALTVGPIFKTITSVKSTKAIWAASYFFSYLMKKIIEDLKSDIEFLVPYTDPIVDLANEEINLFDEEIKSGVGLFPDRFIAIGTDEHYQKTLVTIDTILNEISIAIMLDIKGSKFEVHEKTTDLISKIHKVRLALDEKTIFTFLKDYLQTFCVLLEVGKDENPIFVVNNYLDTLELQQNFVAQEIHPYLLWFFEGVYYNFLVETAFSTREKRFPSVIEIATQNIQREEGEREEKYNRLVQGHLLKDDSREGQQNFLDALQDEKFELKQRHKYLTVVQADGDNIGNLIGKINDENANLPVEDRFTHFSKQLFTFSYQASEIIRKFGGSPIYAGGDDLLFFAPIANNEGRSIDYLVEQLDSKFDELIVNDVELKKVIEKISDKPSMSYGIGKSYYKFPLNEALENSNDLLFREAKKTEFKNTVSFSILKHSGQTFGASLHKSTDESSAYQSFKRLLKKSLNDQEVRAIHSIIYKLNVLEGIAEQIFKQKSTSSEMLANFFSNNFNEFIHENSVFLEEVQKLVLAVFTEKHYAHLSTTEKLEQIYGAIRFVKFLNDKYEKE